MALIRIKNSRSAADHLVCEVSSRSVADLLVCIVEARSPARGKDGLWCFVESDGAASSKICWVSSRSAADILVCFVQSRSVAGWTKEHSERKSVMPNKRLQNDRKRAALFCPLPLVGGVRAAALGSRSMRTISLAFILLLGACACRRCHSRRQMRLQWQRRFF
jgi:hypothetical protein